ncbi:hypothetical protein [Burkholderia gladioli]|uniref:hypothetical protein n=1 Tax=Burkholderia gladioli TaxID=28095 RepID=UPI001640DA44|nr:hypothetical protein [Burkholderia gladioli]
MDLSPYIEGIKATGYPFENWAAEQLLSAKWQIISNRYYVDDDENKAREIDIVAYKASSHDDFDLRTVIIISCKKSEQHHWAFLSRKANIDDPNANWKPVHFWSNYKPISFQIEQDEWAAEYHDRIIKSGVSGLLDQPDYDVFAFQEMYSGTSQNGKKLGAARNDTNIYASVMSAIKAQLYEMSVRSTSVRKKPTIYQFNLLCLADAKFIQMKFNGDEIQALELQSLIYIARNVVNRKQVTARVVFSTKENFQKILSQYNMLHVENKKILKEKNEEFFKKIEKSQEKLKIFYEPFRAELRRILIVRKNGLDFSDIEKRVKSATLFWDKDAGKLKILLNDDDLETDLEKYNNPVNVAPIKDLLKKIYRYEGDFEFGLDILF